jgi:hypothetical protein
MNIKELEHKILLTLEEDDSIPDNSYTRLEDKIKAWFEELRISIMGK